MNHAAIRIFFLLILLFPLALSGQSFSSDWARYPDRVWVGPELWANRLQDWNIQGGELVCHSTLPLRTVHLLTHRVDTAGGGFRMQVLVEMHMDSGGVQAATRAGFLLGAGEGMDYRSSALVQYSYGKGAGLFAGIDGAGRLFVADLTRDSLYLAQDSSSMDVLPNSVRLELQVKPAGARRTLTLEAFAGESELSLGSLEIRSLAPNRLRGNLGLIADAGQVRGFGNIAFSKWEVRGSALEVDKSHLCGPVLFSQYTLSGGILKLTAQLMPLGVTDSPWVQLELQQGDRWRVMDSARVILPGYTAEFRLPGWPGDKATPFRIAYTAYFTDSTRKTYYHEGAIQKEPLDKEELVVAAFTGNHNVARPDPGKWAGVDGGTFPWKEGVWFPHLDLIQHVITHEPDLLFFSGDQVYEGASPTFADFENAELDYLYKWYLWGWAFGELTARIPTVTIPDDHDVYHGNIWGAGGKPTPPGLSGADAQDKGGYKMPPEWVNMVHRTQTSHLPDPEDPSPIEQGISVYHTRMQYGGISFAILADRMFKSAPQPLLPEAQVVNGWAMNDSFDMATRSDVPEASLLGQRQLKFLEDWAGDWRQGIWMKVVLSQTIFANVATLPREARSDAIVPELKILGEGAYPRGDKKVADMDSNGWPQSGRNAALKVMRKGFAVHLAGDQHLGSTIQYGVDEWKDAGYALCVPSIANFFPRRWFPPAPGLNRKSNMPAYAGDFEDGFGNKMTVLAVSNPYRSGQAPALLYDMAPGYGIARFNRNSRKITLEAWPRWEDPARGGKPYEGWPVVCEQLENYGREPGGYLPKFKISGMNDPVVQVIREETGEVVYTLRISGKTFHPWVFEAGRYRVRIGEPGTGQERIFTNLTLSSQETIKVKF